MNLISADKNNKVHKTLSQFYKQRIVPTQFSLFSLWITLTVSHTITTQITLLP